MLLYRLSRTKNALALRRATRYRIQRKYMSRREQKFAFLSSHCIGISRKTCSLENVVFTAPSLMRSFARSLYPIFPLFGITVSLCYGYIVYGVYAREKDILFI